ncbi:acid phosphatase [Segatella maculosa]|uniref:acid phosphatase n=1 Tax=Segatella maculosa TaxID=439703 RepID=UPI00036A4FF7|nr:phosphatase PAP2 family protein [Segatella maculosa]
MKEPIAKAKLQTQTSGASNRRLCRKIALALLVGCAVNAYAQPENKDVRTHPESYFLKVGDVANSLELLPAPPEKGSTHFKYDEERYLWGKSQRETPRGEQASADANVEGEGVPQAFSESFGIQISKELTPEIYLLVLKMREDAGDLACRLAKQHYMRMRPFTYYNEPTCNPAQQQELSSNGSYPSGHTAIGWATALVLAEINIDRQNEILKRGYEMGESRVICGYHFQSDVDAARLVASAVVARLHADEGFIRQLAKAKKEFKRLMKNGKVAMSTHRNKLY